MSKNSALDQDLVRLCTYTHVFAKLEREARFGIDRSVSLTYLHKYEQKSQTRANAHETRA